MAQLLTVKQVAGQLGVPRCGDRYWLKAATRNQRIGVRRTRWFVFSDTMLRFSTV